MKLSHLALLLASTALFAWNRPAPERHQGPPGQLELRYDLLCLNSIKPGSSQVEVRERFGKPDEVEHLPEGSLIWTFKDDLSITTVYLSGGRVVGRSEAGQAAHLSGYELQCRAQVKVLFGEPEQESPETWSYEAGPRKLTFLFWWDRLAKTTLSEGP